MIDGECVDEGVLLRRQRREGRGAGPLERQGLVRDALPLVQVAHVAGVAGVHADHDVELLDPLPEGVELGQRERLAALPGGYRRDADQEDLRPALVDVLELLERRPVAGGEADDRRGVDGIGVHVGPVLVHPLVERVHDRDGEIRVVGDALLERAREGRPEQRTVDAHVLHQLEPRLRVEEGVDTGHDARLHAGGRAGDGTAVAALRDVAAVAARHRDPVERGVRDVLGDVIPQCELGAAADLDVLDRTFVLRREELRERVLGLVEVVVGVEGLVGQPAFVDVDQVLADVVHGALRVVVVAPGVRAPRIWRSSVPRSTRATRRTRMRVSPRGKSGGSRRRPGNVTRCSPPHRTAEG